MKNQTDTKKLIHALLLSPLLALPLAGQAVTPARSSPPPTEAEDVVVLSPFEVSSEAEVGYAAATTLAGNRLNTELRDIGNAVSVITSQFLRDTGAVNNETLLQYTTATEVGNIQGNFTGVGNGANPNENDRFTRPNQNTRVRGLAQADNSRDFFRTDIPWDGYNIDRVDLQRGPNSIIFGQGSPAGIINSSTKQASFRTGGEVDFRFGSYGTTRASLDYNHVLLRNELAIRVAALREHEKFKQDPAHELDKRIYVATRYEPRFLKEGSARTIIRANFEKGDIDSNRPRSMPPYDFITPWFETGTIQGYRRTGPGQYVPSRTFQAMNRATYDPYLLQMQSGAPGTSQARANLANGDPNPTYQPWLGNFGQNFGGILANFNHDNSAPIGYRSPEPRTVRGIGPNGAIDRNIGGIPYNRQAAITSYSTFARNAGLPYSEFGIYKGRSLTDPSTFDFYNNLIDGPNKAEWQDFQSYNVILAQTFMNDKFGLEANYYNESYESGQLSMLTDTRNGIFVDVMETLSDGRPNPNVGRPFITDSGQFGNNRQTVDRNSARLTGFFRHDFTEGDRDAWWRRIVGRHTFTGLLAEDEVERDNRDFQRWAILDPNYYNLLGLPPPGQPDSMRFHEDLFAVHPVIYLGPSLRQQTTAGGTSIPRPTALHVPRSGTVRIFDSTWNAPGVNPAAVWTNPIDNSASTQAENPANYVGWRDMPVEITHAMDSQQNMDLLSTNARLTRSRTTTKALVWQGHFLDGALVGTYGYREDTDKSWSLQRTVRDSPGFGHIDFGPSYRLAEQVNNQVDVTSRSHSIVGHLNQLPFISNLTKDLPINVSLFYSESSNFEPAASRVDIYGESLAPPSGSTRDRGILLETKDGRYSLRINRFKTKVINATSSAIEGSWFIGSSQAWAANWANIFEYNILNGNTIGGADPNPLPDSSDRAGRYNYGPAPGETAEQARAREAAAVAAWRAWQQQVDPRFYQAFGINLSDRTREVAATSPVGLAVTEDATSKGWEFELNASPTRNWRIALNAAKVEAVRENIGGKALSEFVAAYENALRNTAAGDLRIWWGHAGAETTLMQWNGNFGSHWAQRKLQEGTAVPELRQWRVNLVSNYDFTEGFLRGFNAGIGVRWQDRIVVGFPPQPGAVPEQISFDLSSPYYGPTETNFDFWVGYGRKLTPRVDWRIQLNVRNAFEGNRLIPITVQPDGSPAAYRIAPAEIWSVSNVFRF
jgi:outer membrane receptor protein involved in Fe transport